ncbi:MAG: signal peptidase I [Dehalococcoidales bacterium]|nr:signal peptidase I [Dehalococcoidales bacterium]
MKTLVRDILVTLAIAAVIFLALRTTVQSFDIDGPCMEPNFYTGQRVLVNKVVYKFREPQRGDVIIFHSPRTEQGDLIKRIIGLPGESVEIANGRVYIHKDGQVLPLDEPYVPEPARNAFKGNTIPENAYFVLGDNRNYSDDSRGGWVVPRQNIVGQAWLTTWPPGAWGLAANYPFEKKVSGAQ